MLVLFTSHSKGLQQNNVDVDSEAVLYLTSARDSLLYFKVGFLCVPRNEYTAE